MTYVEFDKSMQRNTVTIQNTIRGKCFCDDVLEFNICQDVSNYDLMK